MTRPVVFACVVSMTVVAVNARQPASDDAAIKSAMSAAPSPIGNDATVIDASANGKMRTVRKGTNNFTCMADNPATPGPDPMCGDENAMAWVHAWLTKQTPPANKIDFMYMLAGGSDASNTDPHAQKPTASNNWILAPDVHVPHHAAEEQDVATLAQPRRFFCEDLVVRQVREAALLGHAQEEPSPARPWHRM